MTKKAEGTEERFDQLMTRLEQLVGQLEKGELPLEDALRAFEEGVALVRRGQSRLEQMERRVEQLMTDGSTQPLQAAGAGRGEMERAAPAAPKGRADDDDIPF